MKKYALVVWMSAVYSRTIRLTILSAASKKSTQVCMMTNCLHYLHLLYEVCHFTVSCIFYSNNVCNTDKHTFQGNYKQNMSFFMWTKFCYNDFVPWYHRCRARSETVYAGMVHRHFFGRLEIIPPLLSGRLPYRYTVGRSTAALYEIWSVDCQENP